MRPLHASHTFSMFLATGEESDRLILPGQLSGAEAKGTGQGADERSVYRLRRNMKLKRKRRAQTGSLMLTS